MQEKSEISIEKSLFRPPEGLKDWLRLKDRSLCSLKDRFAERQKNDKSDKNDKSEKNAFICKKNALPLDKPI